VFAQQAEPRCQQSVAGGAPGPEARLGEAPPMPGCAMKALCRTTAPSRRHRSAACVRSAGISVPWLGAETAKAARRSHAPPCAGRPPQCLHRSKDPAHAIPAHFRLCRLAARPGQYTHPAGTRGGRGPGMRTPGASPSAAGPRRSPGRPPRRPGGPERTRPASAAATRPAAPTGSTARAARTGRAPSASARAGARGEWSGPGSAAARPAVTCAGAGQGAARVGRPDAATDAGWPHAYALMPPERDARARAPMAGSRCGARPRGAAARLGAAAMRVVGSGWGGAGAPARR